MKSVYSQCVFIFLLSSTIAIGRSKSIADDIPDSTKLELSLKVWNRPSPVLSDSGNHFVCRPQDKSTIQIIDIHSGSAVDLNTTDVHRIAISHDDSLVACSYLEGVAVRIFDAKTGQQKWESETKVENHRRVTGLEFSKDGSKLLGATRSIHVWDTATGRRIGPAKQFSFGNTTFVNEDGTHLLGREQRREQHGNRSYMVPHPSVFDCVTGEKVLELAAPTDTSDRYAEAPGDWQKVADRPLLAARLTGRSNNATTCAIGVWSTETGKFQKVLYQGTLGLSAATEYRLVSNNRFLVFNDPRHGLQAASTTKRDKQISLPVSDSGASIIGISENAKSIAALTSHTGSIINVSFFVPPSFDKPEQLEQIRETLASLEKLPTAPQIDADKKAEPPSDVGAITDKNDAGAIVTRPVAPVPAPQKMPQLPALREGWILNSLGTTPFAAVGRIVGDEFLMCYSVTVPELRAIDGTPVWSDQKTKLKSRFGRSQIRVFRGNGKSVSPEQADQLLGEEQFVFVLPNTHADANWANQLKPNAIVVSIQRNSNQNDATMGCEPTGTIPIKAFAKLAGVCEKMHFEPHDNLKLSPLNADQPMFSSTLVSTKYETRTSSVPISKVRMEERTRQVPVVVDGETKTKTESYTVNVPYTETVTKTFTVCVPFIVPRFADHPSALATQFKSEGNTTSLRCYRATGQRIHPLAFLAYASRFGSFLEMSPDEKLLPRMITQNVKNSAVVAQFLKQDPAKVVDDEAAIRQKLKQFEDLLAAGEVDKARNALFVLPIRRPLWAHNFYELAYHQHRAGKTPEANETILAGAILEWERPLQGFSAGFTKKHADPSARWVLATRSKVRPQLALGAIPQDPDFAPQPPAPPANAKK